MLVGFEQWVYDYTLFCGYPKLFDETANSYILLR